MNNEDLLSKTSNMIITARNLIKKNEITTGLALIEDAAELRKQSYLNDKSSENLILLLSVISELYTLWAKFGNVKEKKEYDSLSILSQRRIYIYKAISLVLFLDKLDKKKMRNWIRLADYMMKQSINSFGCRLPLFNGYVLNKCPKYESYCHTNPPSDLYFSPAFSYQLYCNKCQTLLLDPKCTHSENDECVRIVNLTLDHMGLVKNPEMQDTGVCPIAIPIDVVLKKEDAKITKKFGEKLNNIDFVCHCCKKNNLQLNNLNVEKWLYHRGIDPSWVHKFLKNFDFSLPIYNDVLYSKKEFKGLLEGRVSGFLVSGCIHKDFV